MSATEDHLALVVGPAAGAAWGAPSVPRAALVGAGVRTVVDVTEVPALAARLEAGRPRWTWWSAPSAGRVLVDAVVSPARAWDVAEAHRLRFGGSAAEPGLAWAGAHGLDLDRLPAPPRGDLFDTMTTHGADDAAEGPVGADGYLLPAAAAGTWATTDERLVAFADALLACARAQRDHALAASPRHLATVHAESAAALLCEELRRDGLPVDRARLLDIVGPLSGPRAERDAAVLALVPGRESTDLRNPAQVRELLRAVGIDVPSTRKHVLEGYRDVHPLVPALLQWRKEERIATTYGLRWIDEHIGPDDRLRGRWSACDGAGGRMTAESGLHNLPAVLRPGVAAAAGHVFVRADLGQIEPRVLAVVSGDEVFAAATRADDLYAPVAARLGVDRATAKIAVLAAMYGQRSGAAGQALAGLERSYPVAMGYLDRAYEAGVRGESVRTYGGRLVPTARLVGGSPAGVDPALDAGRGRFARNAVVQGAAAELFKAWAATVRATTRHLDASIVLCLHDELLVHVPVEHAAEAAHLVDVALDDAARRWAGGAPVRFVADTSVVRRWSEAKG